VENFIILRFPFLIVKERRILEFSKFINIEELLSNKLKQILSLKVDGTETKTLISTLWLRFKRIRSAQLAGGIIRSLMSAKQSGLSFPLPSAARTPASSSSEFP